MVLELQDYQVKVVYLGFMNQYFICVQLIDVEYLQQPLSWHTNDDTRTRDRSLVDSSNLHDRERGYTHMKTSDTGRMKSFDFMALCYPMFERSELPSGYGACLSSKASKRRPKACCELKGEKQPASFSTTSELKNENERN